jgi:hypothetical protein
LRAIAGMMPWASSADDLEALWRPAHWFYRPGRATYVAVAKDPGTTGALGGGDEPAPALRHGQRGEQTVNEDQAIGNTRPSARIGTRVRVLSGAAAGRVGVIAGVDEGHYRVLFEPPVYLPAVGHVASVWRTTVDLEELPQPPSRPGQ